jgi:hypothetical protein
MTTPPRIACAALAIAAWLPAPALAQGARGGSPIHVDFRAIGDDGSIVTDLKPSDLSLKVNGKPRTIQSLTVYQANADAIAASAPLPPPYATNVSGQGGRIIHVLVDDDSISPGRESQIKDAIRILSGELTPNDRIGILNTQGTINITPTSDVTKVRLAASGFTGKAGASETDEDSRCRTKRVIAAVGTIISLSGAAPTTLVAFSSGLATPAVKKVTPGAHGDAGTSDLCPVEPEDFTNLAKITSTANVDLYLFQVVDGIVAGGSVLDAGYESLAGATGAEYIKLPTSPQSAISRLLRETSSYYVATFAPEPGEHNGQPARLELKTARDKVKLRVRPAVMLAKEAAARSVAPKDMLRVATEYRELPLRSTSYASRMPGDPGNTEMRVVALFEPLDAGAAIAAASVGLFDAKGTLKAQWTAQKEDLAKHPARADLQLPPGTYRIRVAAVDANGRGGTTDEDVKAEPVRADPLSLSALVIGTRPQGGGFAPRLEFSTETVAIGLLEIYNVPKSGEITVSLDVVSTPEGQPLATAETTLGRGSADDARTAIGGFGIDNLPPGDYLMRAVVLLDGKPVGRAVRTLRKTR